MKVKIIGLDEIINNQYWWIKKVIPSSSYYLEPKWWNLPTYNLIEEYKENIASRNGNIKNWWNLPVYNSISQWNERIEEVKQEEESILKTFKELEKKLKELLKEA